MYRMIQRRLQNSGLLLEFINLQNTLRRLPLEFNVHTTVHKGLVRQQNSSKYNFSELYVVSTHQNILEQRQTFAPLDQFEQAFVSHIGQGLYHILLRGNCFLHCKLHIFFLGSGRTGEPKMFNVHDFLKVTQKKTFKNTGQARK